MFSPFDGYLNFFVIAIVTGLFLDCIVSLISFIKIKFDKKK